MSPIITLLAEAALGGAAFGVLHAVLIKRNIAIHHGRWLVLWCTGGMVLSMWLLDSWSFLSAMLAMAGVFSACFRTTLNLTRGLDWDYLGAPPQRRVKAFSKRDFKVGRVKVVRTVTDFDELMMVYRALYKDRSVYDLAAWTLSYKIGIPPIYLVLFVEAIAVGVGSWATVLTT